MRWEAISLASDPSGFQESLQAGWYSAFNTFFSLLQNSPLQKKKDRRTTLWLAPLRCCTSGIKRKEELCTALSTSHRKQNWDLNPHQIYLYFWINEHWHKWRHRRMYQPPFSKKLQGKTLKPCFLDGAFFCLLNLGYVADRIDTVLCHKYNTSTCF